MNNCMLPLKIAIIDDDDSVLDAVETVLDGQHWATQTYISGEAFLSDLRDSAFDCIILDAKLSGLSGEAVARAVAGGHSSIPIIVLTAYPDSPQTMKIKQLGARDILVKPVSAHVLIERIQKIVNPVGRPS